MNRSREAETPVPSVFQGILAGYKPPQKRIPPTNPILPADLTALTFVQKDHEEV